MAEKQDRVGLVLKVVGEKAKEDAKPKSKSEQRAETERALPPPVVLPPPEPDPPVLSSALGKQMDDFVNSQPGDRVSLDGGHVLRSKKGFVSRRHGGDMKTHDTPHEAAQHLMATIQTEAHQSRLARHSEREAAQDAVADQHAAARTHAMREGFLDAEHPRGRGGKWTRKAAAEIGAWLPGERRNGYGDAIIDDVPPATHAHMLGIYHEGAIKSPDEIKGEEGHPVWFDSNKSARAAGKALLDRVPDAQGFEVSKINRGHYRTTHQELREGFTPAAHPRQRGGLFASKGALKRELDKPDFGLVTHGPVSIHHNGGGRFQVEAGGEWVIAGHSKEAAEEAFRLARKHKGEALSENFIEAKHPRRGGKFAPSRVRVFTNGGWGPDLHIAYDKKDKPIGHGVEDDGMVTFGQDAAAAAKAHADVMKKVRRGSAKLDRTEELKEGALEESIAIPRLGVPTMLHFDPRLHQRDRLGKFSEMLAKLERQPHGSMLHLPHGIAVRRSLAGLEVSGGGEEKTLRSSHAAAGEALHRHVMGEVARGADFRHESGRLLEDLEQARRDAAGHDPGGAFHLDSRMAQTRKERGRRFEPVRLPSHRGRSNEAQERFARTHGGSTDPVVGAENLQRAASQARRSGARAKTGAQIDAETRKTTDVRGGGSDFPTDSHLRDFYQREFDADGNQTTGRWNEGLSRTQTVVQSVMRNAILSEKPRVVAGWSEEDHQFARETLGEKDYAAFLRHTATGIAGGRWNESLGTARLFPDWPYTKAAQSIPPAKKGRKNEAIAPTVRRKSGPLTKPMVHTGDVAKSLRYAAATGESADALAALKNAASDFEDQAKQYKWTSPDVVVNLLRAHGAHDMASRFEAKGRKNEPLDEPFGEGQLVRLKDAPYTAGKVNRHYGGGNYSVRFVGEKESRMAHHDELRAQKTGADVVGKKGPEGLSKKFGRKNEGLKVRPGVSITRAVDSDRGEIDVIGEDTKGNWHEGGRYEREEYGSAHAEADEMARRHGVELVDEVGSGSHRDYESQAAAAARTAWEDERAGKLNSKSSLTPGRLGKASDVELARAASRWPSHAGIKAELKRRAPRPL